MTSAITTTTIDSARKARATLDASLGLPAVARNGASDLPDLAGWTTTACNVIEAFDWPTPGVTTYVLPIRPEDAPAATAAGLVVTDVDLSTIGNFNVYGISGVTRVAPAPTVDDVKSQKLAAIQARTAALRMIGFEYAGTAGGVRRYTLEHEALRQIELADKWADAGVPEMVYPLVWPSVDRLGFVYMTNAAQVRAFALACSLADRAATEAAAGLEMTLAQAQTIADVNAVVDSR